MANLLNWLGFGNVPVAPSAPGLSVASPWTESTLPYNVIIADSLGITDLPVTRADAMSVAAVAKARHLITSTVSTAPLQCYKGDAEAKNPTFLYRTDTDMPPQLRMLWTVEDLLLNGFALWAVERGSEGQIIDAMRVQPERWRFDDQGRILVNDKPVRKSEVLLFTGPFEGLLSSGAKTIRGALNLERVWQERIENPTPTTILHGNDPNDPLTKTEAQGVVNGYRDARKQPGGTVAWLPPNVDIDFHGENATDLFIQGRNAVVLDIARHTGLPATLLDASNVNSSLTYSTTETSRSQYLDSIINLWARPIEARLSMDDVVPRGQRIAFDFSDLLAVPDDGIAPATED